jgi:Nuclease-related domain
MTIQDSRMRDRMPAQSIIEKLFSEHDLHPGRTTLQRVFGVAPIHRDDLSWHTGAVGERIVANALAKLPIEWHVFHSIPIGQNDADIDHVAVGPGGIFAINTKHHAGKNIWVRDRAFWVSGRRTDYISNSESEAKQLAKALRAVLPWVPDVKPVLVAVNAKQIDVRTKPVLVEIQGAKTVTRWLRKRRPALDAAAVEQIANVIDDPSTWRTTPPTDRQQLSLRFQELTALQDRAIFIQNTWRVLGGFAALAVLFAIFTSIIH